MDALGPDTDLATDDFGTDAEVCVLLRSDAPHLRALRKLHEDFPKPKLVSTRKRLTNLRLVKRWIATRPVEDCHVAGAIE